MNENIVGRYVGKEVKLFLKNKFNYNCLIKEVKDGSATIIDRYGKEIVVETENIEIITPKGDDNE